MKAVVLTRAPLQLLVALAVAVIAVLSTGVPRAEAASSISTVAQALRKSPVYVDPAASAQLSSADAASLARTIENADKPLFVAVLPANFPTQNLFTDLRTATGVTGAYAVRLGDRFDARADSSVLSRTAVHNLVTSVQGEDTATQLGDFADRALPTMRGSAPASWGASGRSGGVPSTALITVAVLLVVCGAGAYAMVRRTRRRRETEQRAALEKLRVVVDEDITAFGEELSRIGFDPRGPDATEPAREDYTRALDAYEEAKSTMSAARHPGEVRRVSEALERGRFDLATLDARLKGEPLPERRPPCFFDPRHGPSAKDVRWTPPDGGTERSVPVCAADATRLADGEEPLTRQVGTATGPRPYWDAGPVLAPWAAGYFGGGLLPGMLMGTVLGSSLFAPFGYGDPGGDFDGGDFSGGDFSGGDFDSRDFGGGFGDGGGFGGGGGDFGGGGGF